MSIRPILINQSLIVLSVAIAVVAGSLLAAQPRLVFPVGGVVAVLVLLSIGQRTVALFHGAVAILVLGYALQGRGFAYLGVPPLYVGEIGLGIGLVAIIVARARTRLSFLHGLIIAFIGLGALRTLPYLQSFGVDAIRDAALWYYALFALLLAATLPPNSVARAVELAARLVPALLIWLTFMTLVIPAVSDRLPHFPGSPVPILSLMKAGERSVVLVALAALMLSGSFEKYAPALRNTLPLLWALWSVSALFVAIQSRGALLAIMVSLAIILLIRPSVQLFRFLPIASVLLAIFILIDPTIETGGRTVSLDQLAINIESIFTDDTENIGGVQGTKNWRLELWRSIVEDTFTGPHFWDGMGFGVNIVSEYGFQVNAEETVRAPHNSHVTVLARMGVPGLALWISINLEFARRMWLQLKQVKHNGWVSESSFALLFAAIWLGSLINTSFDPYLEGPQGAIPFWSVIGAGMLLGREPLRDNAKTPSSSSSPQSVPGAWR